MSFIPFSCRTALTRTFNIMLNKNEKHEQPCLVSDLTGKAFSFSHWVRCWLDDKPTSHNVGLSYTDFIMLRCSPSMPTFWNFYHKQMLIFFASIEMIIWVVFFNLLMWCIILIYLQTLKNPWIPEINPTQSQCMSS